MSPQIESKKHGRCLDVLLVEEEAACSPVYRPDVDVSGIDERRLMRRIDWHVLPWLAVLYLLNFLDRGSIGNAKLYGMASDLHITDKQYLIALTIFFFPYSLFEPLSNLILKTLRPSIWLSSTMLVWGLAMVLHGVVTNYAGLLGVRFLLGLAECGMYPGILFYVSCWYRRNQLGSRVALFVSSGAVSGAFSGLLAAAISTMDGIGGKRGWQWIFILEGLVTVACAFASFFTLSDFPDTATFLDNRERVWVVRQLQADMKHSASGESFKMKYIWQSLKDWKTYIAMAMYMAYGGSLFAFSLFTPTIINQLGFKATAANLLSVPVYAWACLVTIGISRLGDRVKSRAIINIALFGSGLAGYTILICSRKPALSYFAVYLAASSIYPTIPNSVAWTLGNVEGSYKRSITVGMALGWGNLNGAVAANVYREADAPWYRLGHGIVLAYISIGCLSSLIYWVLLKRENAARERGERDEVIDGVDNARANAKNGRFESVEAAKTEKGDDWSGFRYAL